jgi:hypothetical protein
MKKIPGFIIWPILSLIVLLSSFLILNKSDETKITAIFNSTEQVKSEEEVESPYSKALKTPEKVKAIYMTGYTFSSNKRRGYLVDLVKDTELNSVVIDIKDPAGKFAFPLILEGLKDWPISSVAMNRAEYAKVLDELQDNGIYTIARITTFQDPTAVKTYPDLALKNKQGGIWYDYKGVAWMDMTNPEVWKLPVDQAREATLIGFDEVQFDYIRFPSDGNTSQIQYHSFSEGQRKYEVLVDFFKYLSQELSDLPTPLSLDLFGLTYQRRPSNEHYDLNIGQRLVDAAPYFDFISPMVYPSHYPSGFMGFENPAAYPYAVVDRALSEGNFILASTTNSIASTRPWLQDFDMGANYHAGLIKDQIRASDENNASGWILWNASNYYTEDAFERVEN